MSPPNRPRRRGKGQGSNRAGRNTGRGGNRNRANKPKASKPSSRDFWGDRLAATNGEEITPIRPPDDSTALVRSLGDPPLRGHETAAGAYFTAVYGRAASVASALAAASGLLDLSASVGSDDEQV
jgi:hypothetical protein